MQRCESHTSPRRHHAPPPHTFIGLLDLLEAPLGHLIALVAVGMPLLRAGGSSGRAGGREPRKHTCSSKDFLGRRPSSPAPAAGTPTECRRWGPGERGRPPGGRRCRRQAAARVDAAKAAHDHKHTGSCNSQSGPAPGWRSASCWRHRALQPRPPAAAAAGAAAPRGAASAPAARPVSASRLPTV
jgi:hypothetical protein